MFYQKIHVYAVIYRHKIEISSLDHHTTRQYSKFDCYESDIIWLMSERKFTKYVLFCGFHNFGSQFCLSFNNITVYYSLKCLTTL